MNTNTFEPALTPLRNALNNHPVYQALTGIEDIRIFAEAHVYAVWDFMSLLKALQQRLTCLDTPWKPAASPTLTRFVNEIVLAEESDVNEVGETKSHYAMYLDAMEEIDARTGEIHRFMALLDAGMNVTDALEHLNIDLRVKDFVRYTFEVINTGEAHKIAAAFTFGREDLLPDLFLRVLHRADPESSKYVKFRYYLERHIELDGDEHGPLALQMVEELCGNDAVKHQEAVEVATTSLKKRLELWDAIHERIGMVKKVIA